jgi:hypothetical protein
MQKAIQPKSIDEEFPDYQKLLDDMATDPTPVTLPELPSLAANPTVSGLKRSRTLPTEGGEEFEDTGSSGSGTHPEAKALGSADPLRPPSHGLAGQEDAEIYPELDRASVVTVFIGSPLLPELSKLGMDNIATLLALAVDGTA